MEDNELLVQETENVETQTTEEIVESQPEGKFYTDEQIGELVQKRLARQERKLKRDYETKYADYLEAESILNQGLGTTSIKEAASSLKDFYIQKGKEIKEYVSPSQVEDTEILARYEADSIIENGMDEVIEETERLAAKGVENMTPKEKIIFQRIAQYRQTEEENQELKKLGLESTDEFREFSKKLNPNLSTKEKYEIYTQSQPKPKVANMGSMKNTTTKESQVKEFYTPDEAKAFTREDLDKNPELYKAIVNSMSRWTS